MGYLTSQKPGESQVGWSGWYRCRAAQAMGCCQDKNFQTSKGQAKEAESEEVEEEGGTRHTRGPRELERGRAQEVGLGG